MRLNYWIVFCGGDALANPPELVGVESPGEAVISLTTEKFTFELEQAPAAAADLRLVVCASAPQGNGITRAYSKAAVIGGPFAVEAAEIDIKAAYEAKNGAPTAAAPKVFMKYFFVNTKIAVLSLLRCKKLRCIDREPPYGSGIVDLSDNDQTQNED